MGGSVAAERARRVCDQCGKQFVPSSENATPSGKFCSAACYRQWVRLKVRHALGVAALTDAPGGGFDFLSGDVDRSGL